MSSPGATAPSNPDPRPPFKFHQLLHEDKGRLQTLCATDVRLRAEYRWWLAKNEEYQKANEAITQYRNRYGDIPTDYSNALEARASRCMESMRVAVDEMNKFLAESS